MFCQIAFSQDSFERLIKYRIADSFRPPDTPLNFPANKQSWLDGLLVTHIDFGRVENDRFVVFNEMSGADSISPNPNNYGYTAGALSMNMALEVYFVNIHDVAVAGLAQPPVQTQNIPVGLVRITVRISVDPNGVPQLQMELDPEALGGLNLPDQVVTMLKKAGSTTMPFDIGNQMKDIFPPGNKKVLNAGITRADGGEIVLRFTFPSGEWQYAVDMANEWHHFFSADFHSTLKDTDDWCLDLDGSAVAGGLAKTVDPSLKDKAPIDFSPNIKTGYIGDKTPRAVLTKHGLIVNACAGNDINFDVFINVDFSVPSDNLIRGTLSFDIIKNGWDVARCFGVVLVNPLSVFITAVDNGQVSIGLAINVSVPNALIAVGLAGFLIAGFDQTIAGKIIADKLKDKESITKLPGDSYAYDKSLAVTNPFTIDWLVIKHCTGSGGRMLLSGAFNVPDAVLPRLTASDLEGFSKWILEDRCNPGKGQVAQGNLSLSLAPGYGSEKAAVQPVKVPTIPFKWGIRSEDQGNLAYQVLNDPLGIYQDPQSEYREIYVPGIPGLIEVTLKASTLRKPKFMNLPGFSAFPYPLRLRFFTNAGVREYEFKAPALLKDFTETSAEAFERINNCKHRGSSLVLKKYLELIWLVDPPQNPRLKAHLWDVHVQGLAPGRKAMVWNQETGSMLMQAFADQSGRINISLVLSDGELTGSLLVALDDSPFLDAMQLRKLSAISPEESSESAVEIIMRQTILTEIDHLLFEEPVKTLHFPDPDTDNSLVIHLAGERQLTVNIPSPYSPGMAMQTRLSKNYINSNETCHKSIAVWRGKHRQFLQLSEQGGRTNIVAEYLARSSYDLTAIREDMVVQVGNDGCSIILYQKATPVQFGTHEWKDADENSAYQITTPFRNNV